MGRRYCIVCNNPLDEEYSIIMPRCEHCEAKYIADRNSGRIPGRIEKQFYYYEDYMRFAQLEMFSYALRDQTGQEKVRVGTELLKLWFDIDDWSKLTKEMIDEAFQKEVKRVEAHQTEMRLKRLAKRREEEARQRARLY